MNVPARLVFWQNMLAIHQSAQIRALAECSGAEVVLVVDEEIDPERRSLGWTSPDFGFATVVVAPDDETIDRLIENEPERTTHIFSGIHSFPTASRAFQKSLRVSTTRGIFSEPYDGRGVRGVIRRCLSASDRRRYASHIAFVLATGEIGVQWYRRAGFPEGKLYPFGYWMEPIEMELAEPDWAVAGGAGAGPFRLVYVGQFIPRKGVDLLLGALDGLKNLDWTLTLIGKGPWERKLLAMARTTGIASRVKVMPPMDNRDALVQIARHDLLVLPSRFDGWGAVVNESLMCGVPVVCTDRCGAGELVREPWLGDIVRSESAPALREVLARRIRSGRPTPEERRKVRGWTSAISGRSAARYLLDVIDCAAANGEHPVPPWRRSASQAAVI